MKKQKLYVVAAVLIAGFSFFSLKTQASDGKDPILMASSGQNSTGKKYAIKSGIVTFEVVMVGMKSKEILYFDDYGMKELQEKYEEGKLVEASLADGKTMYKIKYDKKIAYKTGDAVRGLAYKFDWNEIPAKDQGTKAKKLPNMTVAGKNCESYSYDSGSAKTTYAGWNNICLFFEQKMSFGNSTTKAVKVEENVAIPADKFKVPAGFTVQ
jgi:hypothetical protein